MSYLTKQQLIDKVNSDFASGKPNKITATDLRAVMLDCADSLTNIEDSDFDSIASKVGKSLIESLKQVWPSNAGTFHFATTSATSKTVSIKTTTGYARLIGNNGSLETVVGNGNPSTVISVVFPESGRVRAFGIVSTTSNGSIRSGNITYISAIAQRIVTFDGSSLTNLVNLYLQDNQLTSFDGSSLSSLTQLYLNGNKIKNFSSTGLNQLSILSLGDNQLYSFSASNLIYLEYLFLELNNITEFDKTGLTNLSELNLSNNPIEEFDDSGLTNLLTIDLSSCQLTALYLQPNIQTYIYINDNLLSSQVLDALFNTIAPSLYTNGGIIDCSTNSGQPTNTSLAARNLMISGFWTIAI
jgi:Leucine-rich repeat (LRR) protein